MYPPVTQFETRQLRLERAIRELVARREGTKRSGLSPPQRGPVDGAARRFEIQSLLDALGERQWSDWRSK
jgi:hypothetical protein